ncbi:MAG: hypothetical protein RL338_1439 [Chloroflexota bacterium]
MTERDRALEALVVADDGTRVEPVTPEDWGDWVTATATRNHLRDDGLADWLELHGGAAGFVRDRDLPGVNPLTNSGEYRMERGVAFEAAVLDLIGARWPVTRIAERGSDARRLEAAGATVEAMRAGSPVIAQGVLRNPANRTFGLVDLLVRSDVLEALVPGTLSEDEASIPAPALGTPWHYRAIDVKLKTLSIDRRRRLDLTRNLYQAGQVWIYNEALGRIQGFVPPASYLLGRSWWSSGEAGRSCFERLGHVPHDVVLDRRSGATLAGRVDDALAWVRRVRTEGRDWSVLPSPSIEALRPNLSNDTSGWSAAKGTIAAELADLTLVKGVTAYHRAIGLAAGVSNWRDERASAELLRVREGVAPMCDAILAANRSPVPVVLPERIEADADAWRTPARLELYVDIETTGDLNDDFTALPERGGRPLIFQIGCGRWDGDRWAFDQWTVDRLTPADERAIVERFLARVDALRREAGAGWDEVRLGHWYEFEPPQFAMARERHPDLPWPAFEWYDYLARIVEPGRVAVTGAFTHQLKPLGKAMHAIGLIETTWAGEVGGGNAAEIAGYRCDEEAARTGGSMNDIPLMDEVKRYNEVDCRAMAEIVRWLRQNR